LNIKFVIMWLLVDYVSDIWGEVSINMKVSGWKVYDWYSLDLFVSTHTLHSLLLLCHCWF
jgi:hypothetical protein